MSLTEDMYDRGNANSPCKAASKLDVAHTDSTISALDIMCVEHLAKKNNAKLNKRKNDETSMKLGKSTLIYFKQQPAYHRSKDDRSEQKYL